MLRPADNRHKHARHARQRDKYVRFKPICNTQNLTIEEQLQIGVRYLDMRFELKDGRKLVAVHSIADCKKNAA